MSGEKTILDKIAKIKSDKEDVRLAINQKGGSLTENALLETFDDSVESLRASEEDVEIYRCVRINNNEPEADGTTTSTTNYYNRSWYGKKYHFEYIDGKKCFLENEEEEELVSFYSAHDIIEGNFYIIWTTNDRWTGGIEKSEFSHYVEAVYVDGRYNDNFILRTFESDVSENGDECIGGTIPESWGKEADTEIPQDGNIIWDIPTEELSCLNSQGNYTTYKISDKFNSDSFTVAFWAKVSSNVNDYLTGVAFGQEGEQALAVGVGTFGRAGFGETVLDGALQFNIQENCDVSADRQYFENGYTATSLNKNYWNHYAFVYDHTRRKAIAYINGVGGEVGTKLDTWFDFYYENLKDSSVYYSVGAKDMRIAQLVISKTPFNKKQIQQLAWRTETLDEITFVEPKIICPETHYLTYFGEEFSGQVGGGEIGRDSNIKTTFFCENFEFEYKNHNLPSDWIIGDGMYGETFGGMVQEEGSYEITGTVKISELETNVLFANTYWNGIGTISTPFKVNIDAIKGRLKIEIREWGETTSLSAPANISIDLENREVSCYGVFDGGQEGKHPWEVEKDNIYISTNGSDFMSGGQIPSNVDIHYLNYPVVKHNDSVLSDAIFQDNTITLPKLGGYNTIITVWLLPITVEFDYFTSKTHLIMLEIENIRQYEYLSIYNNRMQWRTDFNVIRNGASSANISFTNPQSMSTISSPSNVISPGYIAFPCNIKSLRIVEIKENKAYDRGNGRIKLEEGQGGEIAKITFSDYYNKEKVNEITWVGDSGEGNSEVANNLWVAKTKDGKSKELGSYVNTKIVLMFQLEG